MHVDIKYSGSLVDLTRRHHGYGAFNSVSVIGSSDRRWSRNNGNDYSFDLQAIIIGKTGYGKSTTLNALLGKDIVQTNAVEACTRDVQSFEFSIRPGNYLSIADFPGVGESIERDSEYLKIYKKMEARSDAIVYLLRADSRDYSTDFAVLNDLFTSSDTKAKVILALNFCDKIEPIDRNLTSEPSSAQLLNIDAKVMEISAAFEPVNEIVPFSAALDWNLNLLHERLIDVLLSSKYLDKFPALGCPPHW